MGTQILPFTTNMDVKNQAKRLYESFLFNDYFYYV